MPYHNIVKNWSVYLPLGRQIRVSGNNTAAGDGSIGLPDHRDL